jgi:hypothetical protein
VPGLSSPVVQEAFTVRVDPSAPIQVSESLLVIDRLSAEREGVVAHTTAQSAAMEYYEQIVDRMLTDVDSMVDQLEKRGTVSLRTRPLHRFIGRAVGIRNEVLEVPSSAAYRRRSSWCSTWRATDAMSGAASSPSAGSYSPVPRSRNRGREPRRMATARDRRPGNTVRSLRRPIGIGRNIEVSRCDVEVRPWRVHGSSHYCSEH